MLRPWLANLRDEAESLCRTLAPVDLRGRNVYVAFKSEMGEAFQGDGCSGMTCKGMDLVVRPYIAGRWRGRGAAMFIDDVYHRRTSTLRVLRYRGTATKVRKVTRAEVLCVVLHELSHIVDRDYIPTPDDAEPPATYLMRATEMVTQGIADADTTPEQDGRPPYTHHEARFVRACCHLSHRANAAGLPMPTLYDPDFYRLSSQFAYARALGDEPARFAGASIQVVLDLPAPPAFDALWAADVRRWEEKQLTAATAA